MRLSKVWMSKCASRSRSHTKLFGLNWSLRNTHLSSSVMTSWWFPFKRKEVKIARLSCVWSKQTRIPASKSQTSSWRSWFPECLTTCSKSLWTRCLARRWYHKHKKPAKLKMDCQSTSSIQLRATLIMRTCSNCWQTHKWIIDWFIYFFIIIYTSFSHLRGLGFRV